MDSHTLAKTGRHPLGGIVTLSRNEQRHLRFDGGRRGADTTFPTIFPDRHRRRTTRTTERGGTLLPIKCRSYSQLDELLDRVRVPEPNFRLRGMDVDVDLLPGHLQVQEEPRAHTLRDRRSIPALDCPNERRRSKGAAIHEKVAPPDSRPRRIRPLNQAGDRNPLAGLGGPDQRSCLLQTPHLTDPLGCIDRGSQIEEHALVGGQHEGHTRIRQSEGRDHLVHCPRFGTHRLQEARADRRVVEEVPHVDRGSPPTGKLGDIDDPAGVHLNTRPQIPAAVPGLDRHARHGGNRGHGLTTEAKRRNSCEFVRGRDLACGMSVEAEQGIFPTHARSVITYADPALPPPLDGDLDSAGLRIQSILHELLHHGGWPFNSLPGGNLVRYSVGKYPNRATHADSTP